MIIWNDEMMFNAIAIIQYYLLNVNVPNEYDNESMN